MSSIGSCFRILCRLISEFVRFILFFTSLFFVLVSILFLLSSIAGRNFHMLVKSDGVESYYFVIIALAIYLITLGGYGIYGSFFRSNTSMEWFALLASLNVVLGIGIFIFVSTRSDDSNTEVFNKLKDLQPKYDWFNETNQTNEEIKNATLIWNRIQITGECCGLNEPKDWIIFKPKNITSNVYPESCCEEPMEIKGTNLTIGEKFCYEQTIWEKVWTNLVLALMACIVRFFGPSRDDYYDYS